jgi:hypothetical protein
VISVKNASCTDDSGVPVSNVTLGTMASFTVFIENKGAQAKNYTLFVNVYDNSNSPIGHSALATEIQPNTINFWIAQIEIPTWANTGNGTVFASAYTALPDLNGVPYCPEVSSTFTILGQQGGSAPSTPQGNQGNYNLTIRATKSLPLGTYNIFVSSTYNGINAYSSGYFDVFQPGDLAPAPNGDGSMNSADTAAFVTNYLKYYAGLSYDHHADMDGNGIMNSNDVTLYVNAYLTYSSWN